MSTAGNRLGPISGHPIEAIGRPSRQVRAAKPRNYRMDRRLSLTELNQLTELYRLGMSTYELARQFGTDRHTITRHLKRANVTLCGGQIKHHIPRLHREVHG